MTDQKPVETESAVRSHRTIAAALAAAQAEMGRAQKSANNPHFRTKYADLDSVCDAAMPALNRHGIAVVQPLQKDGDEWLVMTRFVHGETGEMMETPMPLLLGKRDMQGLGSAITYARRYGLMTLAGIAPEDDDGNAAAASGPAPQPHRNDAPPFNPRGAADRIITAIKKADSLDTLSTAWRENADTIAKIRAEDAASYQDVEAHKNARKADLKPAPNADLGGDEIPY